MILKEYQKTALQAVRTFLDLLVEWRGKEATARGIDPDITFDWVARAWEKAGTARAYLPRKNGLGEPLPTFCLKIPTGGGKTLLATKVIDLVNTHYRRQQAGLVLWIVPTTQIYNQTLKALKDRDHPYRQQLDVSSAGKTLILEKNSGFKPQDVRERLCVLLLMLPSANQETKESAADVSGQRRVRQLLSQRGRRQRPGEAARPRCRTWTPSSPQAACGASRPKRLSATRCVCCSRSSSWTRATRHTASTPRRRWKASTRP